MRHAASENGAERASCIAPSSACSASLSFPLAVSASPSHTCASTTAGCPAEYASRRIAFEYSSLAHLKQCQRHIRSLLATQLSQRIERLARLLLRHRVSPAIDF